MRRIRSIRNHSRIAYTKTRVILFVFLLNLVANLLGAIWGFWIWAVLFLVMYWGDRGETELWVCWQQYLWRERERERERENWEDLSC